MIVPASGVPGPPGPSPVVWRGVLACSPGTETAHAIPATFDRGDGHLVFATANGPRVGAGLTPVAARAQAWIDEPGVLRVYLSAGADAGLQPVSVMICSPREGL